MNWKYILINLFTNKTYDEPVRLAKQDNKMDFNIRLNILIQRNFYIIALASIIILLTVFILFCFAITGISATESGTVYNGLNKVI